MDGRRRGQRRSGEREKGGGGLGVMEGTLKEERERERVKAREEEGYR